MAYCERAESSVNKSNTEDAALGSAYEPVSVVFKNGLTNENDLTNLLHSVPCKIEYDGPAKVSQFFIREKMQDGEEIATFRGRIFNGVRQDLPEGYRLYVTVEKEKEDNIRVFEVIGSAQSFMLWELHRCSDYHPPLARAIDYLAAAETFANSSSRTF